MICAHIAFSLFAISVCEGKKEKKAIKIGLGILNINSFIVNNQYAKVFYGMKEVRQLTNAKPMIDLISHNH